MECEMPVVFDEVIANIESPPEQLRAPDTVSQGQPVEQDELKTLQLLETRLRHQQRLEAD